MKPDLRKILADSHIAAVAIVVILVWSLEWILDGVWTLFFHVGDFLVNAIANLEIPNDAHIFDFSGGQTLFFSLLYCLFAVAGVATAWILSRWVYGAGPIGTLRRYQIRFLRRGDA